MRFLARVFALLMSVFIVSAVALALMLRFEYGDDTVMTTADGWLMHGFVTVPVLIAIHLWKRSALLLAVPCFMWTVGWESLAIRGVTGLPFGWAVQVLAAPLLPLVPLLLAWMSWPRKPPPGLCPGCGYDLRATPDRCPECGAVGGYTTSEKDVRVSGRRHRH